MIFITDPWFYAWAIPAVIITGISKTGLGAGVGGVAVPMMSQVIAPGIAAGIMLPILCLMDVLGLRAYRGKWAWNGVKQMMLPALIGIAIGALSFNSLSVNTTKVFLGAISIAFSLYQLVPALRNLKSWMPEFLRPWVWCGLSGFTSTLAHAGGPPITIYLWPKKLDRTEFMAVTVVFFTVVNAVKLIPFAMLGQLNVANLGTALALMPFAPIGVWLGVRLNNVINDVIFRRVTLACLFVLGLRLLYEGLK